VLHVLSDLRAEMPAIVEVAIAASRDDDAGAKIGCQVEHSRASEAERCEHQLLTCRIWLRQSLSCFTLT
jgi:hypothetical protein